MHLNYFEPYQSKPGHHEDQLTRAYLVLLRFSHTALMLLYDLIRSELNELPPLSQVGFSNVQIETQKTDIGHLLANNIVSVLITDESIEFNDTVKHSDRTAVYDGLIKVSDDFLLIIENKPRSSNVWLEQLSPNLKDYECELIDKPAIIEWKSIITNLNTLVSLDNFAGSERMMINDFLEYVNRHYSFLNPFDELSLCKNDFGLLQKRLQRILETIYSKDEKSINYQSKWKSFYVETGLKEIRMLIFNIGEKDEYPNSINIELYFGDTQSQATHFYNSCISYSDIEKLKRRGWTCHCNFHLSFMSSAIIDFKTSISEEDYFNYWLENKKQIFQRKKEEIDDFIKQMGNRGIIDLDDKMDIINKEIFGTKRDRFNICPGFLLRFSINLDEAIELDKKNELAKLIHIKANEGLAIINSKT